MLISPGLRGNLLATETLEEFLVLLRGGLNYREVAELVHPHGGPSSRSAICNHEKGVRHLSSRAQLAYVRAFGLDDELAVCLQRLAGEAQGLAGNKTAA